MPSNFVRFSNLISEVGLLVPHDNATKLKLPFLGEIKFNALINVVRLSHVNGAIQNHIGTIFTSHPNAFQLNVTPVLSVDLFHEEMDVIWPESGWWFNLVVSVFTPIWFVVRSTICQKFDHLGIKDFFQQTCGLTCRREWYKINVTGVTILNKKCLIQDWFTITMEFKDPILKLLEMEDYFVQLAKVVR